LKGAYTLEPGGRELVAAVSTYPSTLRKVKLTIYGAVTISGAEGSFKTKTLIWGGYMDLESQKLVIIMLDYIGELT